MDASPTQPPTADRRALDRLKLTRLNTLLAEILPANRFYAARFGDHPLPLASLAELEELAFTTKADLVEGFGDSGMANQTWPAERYVRFHQTSGSHGRPLPVWDTAADWQWWMTCWQTIYERAGLQPGEGVFVAASFGPYIGFWSGFDAAVAAGGRAIPTGGLSTSARLQLLQVTGPALLLATPSYALRLAEVAAETGDRPLCDRGGGARRLDPRRPGADRHSLGSRRPRSRRGYRDRPLGSWQPGRPGPRGDRRLVSSGISCGRKWQASRQW